MQVQKQKNQLNKVLIIVRSLSIFLLIVILFTLNSCSQNTKAEQLDIFENIQSNKIEHNDSLYIMCTINLWIASGFDVYHDYSRDGIGIKKEQLKFKIIKTFYSPDRLKIFCWIVRQIPNNPDCSLPQGYSFSSSDIIGFRNNLNEKWKLYPLELQKAGCSDSEDWVLNQLGQYYFYEMKNHCEDVNKKYLDKKYGGEVRYDLENQTVKDGYGDKTSPFILKNYGYNLQDKNFWDKSLIWQKGARIPGLYNFQTKGNVTPDEIEVELLPPQCK